MKKLDKRSIFILVVTISFLIAMVIYGAYAVINVSPQVNTNNLNIHSNISNRLSFTVDGGNVMNLEISKINMDESLAGNYVATSNDNLTINLTTDGKQAICCTYNVAWEWIEDSTTANQYTKSNTQDNEFTLAGTTTGYSFEVQLPNYDSTNLTNELYEASICSSNNGTVSANVSQVWNFSNKLYNLNVNQDALKAGNFKGKAKIVNVNCDVDLSISNEIYAMTNQTSSQTNGGSWAIVNEGNGLRYEGKDPDNYLCFKQSCTDDELYRIIGKFTEMVDTTGNGTADTQKQVIKIIKNTSIGNNAWASSGTSNNWASASLYSYLNHTWGKPLNNILTTRYYTKGPNEYIGYTASQFLNLERNGYKSNNGYADYVDAKVGLMYPSDYMYAAPESTCARSTTSYGTGCSDNDWLNAGLKEWLITPQANLSRDSYFLTTGGGVSHGFEDDHVNTSMAVRPVFYIDASTDINSGNGSKANPYKIISPINWGYWFSSTSYAKNQMPSSYSQSYTSSVSCGFRSNVDLVGDNSVYTIHSTCLSAGPCVQCTDNTCSNYLKNGVYDIRDEFIKAGISNPSCTSSATEGRCYLYQENPDSGGNPFCGVTNTGVFYCHLAFAGYVDCQVNNDGTTAYDFD